MTIKCVTVPFKNISIITHQHQMSNKLLSKEYFCNELTQIYFPYFCSYETRHMVEQKVAKNIYNLFKPPWLYHCMLRSEKINCQQVPEMITISSFFHRRVDNQKPPIIKFCTQ